MANSLYQQLTANQPTMTNSSNIQNMFNMVKNSGNPMQMINQLAQNNPQLRNIMNMIQNSNMSPQQLFMQMANQRGINPQTIMNMLR